jgi:hypothetical protein
VRCGVRASTADRSYGPVVMIECRGVPAGAFVATDMHARMRPPLLFVIYLLAYPAPLQYSSTSARATTRERWRGGADTLQERGVVDFEVSAPFTGIEMRYLRV